MLQGFDSISLPLLEKFKDKEKNGLLFYQYAMNQFKSVQMRFCEPILGQIKQPRSVSESARPEDSKTDLGC